MQRTLEANQRTALPSRYRRILLILAAVAGALIFFGQQLLDDWVDLLWFDSLSYAQVFWRSRLLAAGAYVFFGAVTFAVLFASFGALKRMHGPELPSARSIVINGQPLNFSIQPILRILRWIVSLVIGFLTGASMAGDWPTFALFLYAPRGGGQPTDPIFGRSLNFFLFSLPAWQLLLDWLLTLAILTCAMAILFLVLTASSRALTKSRFPAEISPWRGLSFAAGLLLLVLAGKTYLDRFARLLDHHTIFDGVTYTDAHVTLAGSLLVCLALLAGAAIAFTGAVRNAGGIRLALAIAPAAVCYVLLGLVSWYVSGFVVKPNELVKETPYIANNIASTRTAFGLDHFQRQEFPAETTLAAADPANNQPTLQNIRLWDWHALQDTLRQVQEIRTYYDFPDIDIDRYVINGKLSEVMLATRELNVEKLPESSRNWINEKLIYTHGYGITMNSVNGFTSEGLPTFLLSDMPVQGNVPGLAVTRPEIYFGQLTDTDVYVKTRQQEFDYPQGQTNSLTSYQGNGGIALGGFFRRVFLALNRGDLGKVPFSDDIGTESRLLMRRNIRERVNALAPFLTFDPDPYIVVGDDGHLSYILDAFTVSDSYPYATHYALGDRSVNYMRNSVKVVVDAYTGATTFYVFDSQDPILAAYRRIFPALFQDASAMPAGLRRHVRYPELLFRLQSAVYGLYHMTDPSVFFNREDLWTVATETTSDTSGGQTAQPMPPNFVLMKLPGATGPAAPNGVAAPNGPAAPNSEEFVEILPFTPANRNNLIGWIAGRSDGANYGTAVVYDFPKSRLVDGPQQIEARIDQNAELSGQLTLWNQQGSHVLRGNLLVIPTGRALLYAEPIYLQAQESPMPELRLVVLALQDKLAYGPSFAAALSSLFGAESPPPATAGAPATSASNTPVAPATDQRALITQAGKAFDDYQHLTAGGKLGEAGQKLEDLKRILGQLRTPSK